MLKRCCRCKTKKDDDFFYKDKGTKDGFASRCKQCDSLLKRERRARKGKKMFYDLKCETCSRKFTGEAYNMTECAECVDFHKQLEKADKERDVFLVATCTDCKDEFSTQRTHDGLQKYRRCHKCLQKQGGYYG